MTKTKVAILSISLLSILLNAGIIPIFSILASELPGATPNMLKFTLSISSLFCVLFSLLTGYLDRFFPKKIMLAVGLILYAIGGMSGGLVNSMTGLLVTRAVMGVGAGICLPLATAFIADFYDGEERKETFGYSLFSANFGAMLLPLIGTWLAEVNWRLGFTIYAIAILILVLTWLNIPAKPHTQNISQHGGALFNLPSPVLWASFLYFIVMLLFVSLPSNFSIFIKEENLGTPSTAAIISSLSTLVAMVVSLNFARIFRIANERMLTIGLMMCGSGFAVMSIFPGLWPTIAGNCLIGGSLGMLHPLFPFMAAQASSHEQSTTALALVNSGFRMGTFVSPFFFLYANSIIGVVNIRGEFLLSAMIFGLVTVISVVVFARRKPLNLVEKS
jgi:MFS family permease